MLVKSIASCCALTALLAATTANAKSPLNWPDWYAGLHVGVNSYDSANTLTPQNTGTSYGVDADAGYIFGASLGYAPTTGNPLIDATRWEVEYSFRDNGLSAVDTTPQGGELLSHTAMANVILDYTNPTIFTPYVGAGYGFSEFDFDGDDETATAWQFLAGVDYTPEDIPPVSVGLRYRYMDTEEGPITYEDELSDLTYENHSVELTSQLRF